MEENKIYYLWGYKIERKYHYVDAHQHYDYVVKFITGDKTFPSLTAAKNAIRKGMGLKPLAPRT